VTAPISPLTPPLAAERPVVWPQRTRATLACGIPVVLVERHIIPKISLQLFFRSGSAIVEAGHAGLAEMTSAVIRTGTSTRDERRIDEDLRRIGADLGAGSGADSSWIAAGGLSEFSAELVGMIADIARQPSFPAKTFEREKRNAVEAIRLERTSPGFLAGERLRKVVFGSHPYAVVSPTEAQLQACERAQLVEFHRANYAPANALLLAVGDFSPARMIEQLESAFVGWTGGEAASIAGEALPSHAGRHVSLVHLPGSVQTQIVVGNLAITRRHADWLPLTLANAIFGGAFHSRLVANIREQKGYTYSPRSTVHALRQHGYFTVNAAVRNEVVAATLTEIFYELDRMRALPVSEDEISDARAYLSGVFSLGLATLGGLGGQLATQYLYELPEDYLETYRDKIRALTLEEVLAASRAWFDSANARIVVVGDAEQVAAQARLFGDVQEYDAQGALR
jgi:predicted Zn-dependent peptidase